MSKAVMISIQPKWCELIASGKKTIEIRKTKPKLATPFKCYIYCTKGNIDYVPSKVWLKADVTGYRHIMNGRVIGEFTCNSISEYEAEFHKGNDDYYQDIREIFRDPYNPDDDCRDYSILTSNDDDNPDDCEFCKQTCLTFEEVKAYIGGDGFMAFYGWHISDLVIYDKPIELSKFWEPNKCRYNDDGKCTYKYHCFRAGETVRCGSRFENPPQSWRYVEEMSS